MRIFSRIMLIAVSLLCTASAFAQTATPQSKTFTDADIPSIIKQLDREFFDAYNRCDLVKFASMLDENVEFYHDKGGYSAGRDSLVESVRRNICNKVRRELVGEIEAYPINKFGAFEVGSHLFYEGKNQKPSGEAKFFHLWKFTPDGWRLTRIFSVDHKAAAAK